MRAHNKLDRRLRVGVGKLFLVYELIDELKDFEAHQIDRIDKLLLLSYYMLGVAFRLSFAVFETQLVFLTQFSSLLPSPPFSSKIEFIILKIQ